MYCTTQLETLLSMCMDGPNVHSKSNTLHRRQKERKRPPPTGEKDCREDLKIESFETVPLSSVSVSQYLSLLLYSLPSCPFILLSWSLLITCVCLISFPDLFSSSLYVCVCSSTTVTPFLCHLNSHNSSSPIFLPLSISLPRSLSQSARLRYQLMNIAKIVTTSLLKFTMGHVQTVIWCCINH